MQGESLLPSSFLTRLSQAQKIAADHQLFADIT